MYLCIGFLAFSATTLAQVSAYYQNTLKLYQNGERRNNRTAETIEFVSPYGITFGWCAPQENAHKEEPGVVTLSMSQLEAHSQWDCTFIAKINQSVNCITRFQTQLKSNYVITLSPETYHNEFTIEYNQPEAQIRVQSPSIITMGRCFSENPAMNATTKYMRVYNAYSSITLNGEGFWDCVFHIRDRPVVHAIILLRRGEHNRIYETKEPVPAQGRMDSLLNISEILCHSNESSIIRHPLNSSYVSIDKSGNGDWQCNFNENSNNSSCTFTVREIPSGSLVIENTVPPVEEFTVSAGLIPLLVVVCSVAGVALVIILLICVIFYYKNKVKNLERNNLPPNIINRTPFEMPSEIVYDYVYSHPAGLKRPGQKKEKNTDKKQLIEVK